MFGNIAMRCIFIKTLPSLPMERGKNSILPALELTMNQVRDLFPDPDLTSRGLERPRRIRWEPGVAPTEPDLRSEGKPKK